MKRKREWTKNSKEKLKGILTKIDFFFLWKAKYVEGIQLEYLFTQTSPSKP